MKTKLPQYIENEQIERVRSRLKSVQPTRTSARKAAKMETAAAEAPAAGVASDAIDDV